MLEFDDVKRTNNIIEQRQKLRRLRFKLKLIEEYADMAESEEELSLIDEKSIDEMYKNIKGKGIYSFSKHFI